MQLDSHCYQQMFYGCTSLTEAPELPATKLAEECYGEMFGYSGLKKKPRSCPPPQAGLQGCHPKGCLNVLKDLS